MVAIPVFLLILTLLLMLSSFIGSSFIAVTFADTPSYSSPPAGPKIAKVETEEASRDGEAGVASIGVETGGEAAAAGEEEGEEV